ncbi:MAG: hypothetical protein HY606_09475 [Planctomycetes bacterium]|nr:hypothetical protein [Planctomycetota bacterium]
MRREIDNSLWPFDTRAKAKKWQRFLADGFAQEVCGCIFPGNSVESGLPLGSLGTGYITLEGNGLLGKTTIFNEHTKPRLWNRPFLAFTYKEQVYTLSLESKNKSDKKHQRGGTVHNSRGVDSIDYWGHFPIADMRISLKDIPVKLGLRAFTPFILGNADNSNIPAVLFEIRLNNTSTDLISGCLAFSFPGSMESTVTQKEGNKSKDDKFRYNFLEGEYKGISVTGHRGAGYALSVENKNSDKMMLLGKSLGSTDYPWTKLLSLSLTRAKTKMRASIVSRNRAMDIGASIVFHYNIKAGESQPFRFVLAWFYPYFKDSGGEPHKHHYSRLYGSARDVAEYAITHFDKLLKQTLSWQNDIYKTEEYPDWLKDGLINSLYSLSKNTLWVVSDRPDNWYLKEGLFTHNESFTTCSITETMVCRMHGHIPLLLFFPELERTTLHAFKHYQLFTGEIPFSFGMGTSLRDPRYQCQHPLNSSQYVQMVYRYYLRTKDKKFLKEFYNSVKSAINYQQTLDYDKDGLVNEHSHAEPGEFWPANQFYDMWPWYGTSAYVAGTWLATLACGNAIANQVGDKKFAMKCSHWLKKATVSYRKKLWNGNYYRLYNDPENGRKKETCLSNQLMAQWCVKLVGLSNVLPEKEIQQALDSISRLNFKVTKYGLVNGVNPDNSLEPCGYYDNNPDGNDHGRQIFFGENMCAAMTFIYHGRKKLGIEIARRLYESVSILRATTWNQRCLISSCNGRPVWGDDYYSNMVIWALPLALKGEKICPTRWFYELGGSRS